MRALLIVAALLLSACVRSEVASLDQRHAIISARGSAFNSHAEVVSRVMHQAATEALARGFTHFVILDGRDATTTGAYYSPASSTTNIVGSATCTGYTCAGSAVGNTTYNPGYSFPIVKPGADVEVFFLHANEVDPAKGAWLASDVVAHTQ
jgi:hypothetical protein